MIQLSNLEPTVTKTRKRVGRGEGSNRGKNAGKGHKGQTKHGGKVPIGFEGGQKSLKKRQPKLRGFKQAEDKQKVVLTLLKINTAYNDGDTVSFATMLEKKLITSKTKTVRIVSTGSLDKKLTFEENENLYLTKGVKSVVNK
jgi:large subunit ribosomal protein L15